VAVTASDRAIIERWCGPLSDVGDVDAAEERLGRLGNAHMAALETLMVTRAAMINSPASVRSGQDAVDHRANLGWIRAQIDALAATISELGISTDDDLVLAATGATTATTVTVTARNRRRG
jgi:hypothetical protein